MKKIFGLVVAALVFLTACASGPKGVQTVTYEYTQNVTGLEQQLRETITYEGKEFKTIAIEMSQPMEEYAAPEGIDFATVKEQLMAFMEENQTIKDLKAVEGVTLEMDLTEDYTFTMNMTIDMTKVDVDALGSVAELGVDLSEISNATPQDYIKSLEENGAKKVEK